MTSDTNVTERLETLIARLEALPDRVAKETAREAISAVLTLHKEALVKILERLPAVQLQALSTEPLVSSLLVLHDLHPSDLELRVRRAVEKVQPLLALNGAAASATFSDGEVQLTLSRSAGCGSTAGKLRTVLEQAVAEAAPDARAIRIAEAP
jgi:hypothetical protein